jgi:hypothetical protein
MQSVSDHPLVLAGGIELDPAPPEVVIWWYQFHPRVRFKVFEQLLEYSAAVCFRQTVCLIRSGRMRL